MAEIHEGLFSQLEKLSESDDISSKGNRRRSQKDRAIYTPGSGPLKKSENCDEEVPAQQTQTSKNRKNQKFEGPKEDKVTNSNGNRSQGGKKDHVLQSGQNDKRNNHEKNNSKNSNIRNDMNSKDAKSKKAPSAAQNNKSESLATKEPKEVDDKTADGKQKNRKPDSQIYVVPKPARPFNSSEQLNELAKDNQGDPGKNNKTFPKPSKFKSNNFRNEPSKNFARPHTDHDRKRSQGQKYSKENEESLSKSNPKGTEDSYRGKPFREGRNRNFSHSSFDDSSRSSSSFPANKLPPTVNIVEPCNKPSNFNNPGTSSTNIPSNYDNKPPNVSSYPASQHQEVDASKNVRPTSEPKSTQQNSFVANLTKNSQNSDMAPTTGEPLPYSRKFSQDRRPHPGRNVGYEGGHSFRRNSTHNRGPFNDRCPPGHDRGSGHDRGFGHDRGPGHDRSSGHERGPGHERVAGQNRGPYSDRGTGHDREAHSDKGLVNDRGPPPEGVPGNDRGAPPDNVSTQNRMHLPERGPNSNRGPDRGPDGNYPPAGRGRYMSDRGPPMLNKGPGVDPGYSTGKGFNTDFHHPQIPQAPEGRQHYEVNVNVERNPLNARHGVLEKKLSLERPLKNDTGIPIEQNPLPDKDRFPERNPMFAPGPAVDPMGSFSYDRNPVPPPPNWNPNQERNFPPERNSTPDRGPPSQVWEPNNDRNYSRGRGSNFERNHFTNAPPNMRRPMDKGPVQDFYTKYDMAPPHEGPPMMAQASVHERPMMRDRMHKSNNKAVFMAPRFMRKAMEENRMKGLNPNMDFIGTNSEHKWDGSSATYSSSRDNYTAPASHPQQPPHHPPPPHHQPPPYNQPNQYSQSQPQPLPASNWTHPQPLPHPKQRGRGFQRMDGPDRKFINDRPGRAPTPERIDLPPGMIRTNLQNKTYPNDGWKKNEPSYRSDRNWEHPDEHSDSSRRDRRLMSQSDTSSVDYQSKTVSRDSFSSDHSERVNVNGNREDSSNEEDDDDEEEKDDVGKSIVPGPFSMNWADVVDKNDDEISEPPVRHEDPCEPIRSPTDRTTERNRRRRKKSISQDRDLSRRRDSNISGSRQDIRFARNESLERKEWGRSKPMGSDRNRRRDNGGGWSNDRPVHRDRDRDRGGRERRHRNRSSRRGTDKHRDRDRDRDRERADRDPENWRARNDSVSDRKQDFEARPRDDMYRDGTARREPVDVPKCPSVGGILHLPSPVETSTAKETKNLPHQEMGQSKQLFNHNDPGKPIFVPLAHKRPGLVSERSLNVAFPDRGTTFALQSGAGDSISASPSASSKPAWYDPGSESFRSAKDQDLLLDIGRADRELQWLFSTNVIQQWSRITELRKFLELALEALLVYDLKFCEAENIECHVWKIAYHNLIELLRKLMSDNSDQKNVIRKYLLELIEQGTEYFKRLLNKLEETYKIKFDTYVSSAEKVTSSTSIALISAQKLFIFLGDLARYKEQVNETTNYGSARTWYLKAREMNPKNGKPYNQLALIAFCSKRKIDAVYYYMRSLMASNPIQSAKESLLSIFDGNRKKYESIEKKRMEDREKKNRDKAKEKESFTDRNKKRREIWIRPDDGTRKHMTLTTKEDSEDEELSLLSHIEVNKRFGVSFLHIQGKLFNKVGMETFQDAAHQMLREFRALLQHSPMALTVTRFLQLLALNMFAIENTQLKDKQLGDDSEVRTVQQESALLVSLQMFNIILERAIQLLKEQFTAEAKGSQPYQSVVGSDLEILMPAIKVWCDWLMYHEKVWNPPPSCRDYLVGPASADCWNRLATLANYIEKLEFKNSDLIEAVDQPEDSILVSLPEDSTLRGFSPLTSPYPSHGSVYTSKSGDIDLAQMHHRIKKVLFFTTAYLCGLEPPVLKLQKNDLGHSEYISVVEAATSSRDQSDVELCTESMSEGEDCEAIQLGASVESDTANYDDDNLEKNSPTKETRNLLLRKEHLERVHESKERYEQQVNAILEQCSYSVEMEVKPKYLVPDTNCFIDYLTHLRSITKVTTATNENLYSLMVPLIVHNELQGLSRGIKKSTEVAESAKEALEFLSSRSPAVKCVTTKGAIVHHASNFTEEEDDNAEGLKNDDKILETCINLCKNKRAEESKEGEPQKIHRNVVLLTDDRHLRVKALCRNMPVRKVPDFIRWAGLG